jgi:hypothetical protein
MLCFRETQPDSPARFVTQSSPTCRGQPGLHSWAPDRRSSSSLSLRLRSWIRPCAFENNSGVTIGSKAAFFRTHISGGLECGWYTAGRSSATFDRSKKFARDSSGVKRSSLEIELMTAFAPGSPSGTRPEYVLTNPRELRHRLGIGTNGLFGVIPESKILDHALA